MALAKGVLATLACVFCVGVQGTWDLPPRARGGRAGRQFSSIQAQGHVSASEALSWKALVDNFGNSSETYDQRYYVNSQYWNPETGPIFLSIGGESTLSGPPGG
jgi:hypothetical protein